MKRAFIFPGQGAQHPSMAKDLYDGSPRAKELLDRADSILGFKITEIMFEGTTEQLKRTDVTQPAVFLHSAVLALTRMEQGLPAPDMVAGHSLGEYSALCAAGVLSFEDALSLVRTRANAMQKCCEAVSGTMAAVVGANAQIISEACLEASRTSGQMVLGANYNTPVQTVISGTAEAVALAGELISKRCSEEALRCMVVPLEVGGAFHSPLMEPAAKELAAAIEGTQFHSPICPVWQNVTAKGETDPAQIRKNLLAQLTSPVRWSETILGMIADGCTSFTELGPGKVLTGMMKKIAAAAEGGARSIFCENFE